MEFLKGKKTYIVAGAAMLVVGAQLLGFVDTDTANQALAALGFGAIVTLRAAVAKV